MYTVAALVRRLGIMGALLSQKLVGILRKCVSLSYKTLAVNTF